MNDVTPAAGSSAAAERIRAATAGEPVGGARVDPLPDPERTYVTIREAIALTGVTRRTVMMWLADGRVQKFKGPNGYSVLIDKLELLSFDRARRGDAPVVIDGEPVWD